MALSLGAASVHGTRPRGTHNHPWPFTTHIVRGSYVEEIFHRNDDGTVSLAATRHRVAGSAHDVDTDTIHRIIALPEGECWTFALYGPDAGFRVERDEAVNWFDISVPHDSTVG